MKHVKLRLTPKEADMLHFAATEIQDDVEDISLPPHDVAAYRRAMDKLRAAIRAARQG